MFPARIFINCQILNPKKLRDAKTFGRRRRHLGKQLGKILDGSRIFPIVPRSKIPCRSTRERRQLVVRIVSLHHKVPGSRLVTEVLASSSDSQSQCGTSRSRARVVLPFLPSQVSSWRLSFSFLLKDGPVLCGQ